MIVMKFGGSALQTANKIRDVTSIVQSHLHQQPVLVLSAMGTTTDDLIAAGHRAAQHQDARASIEKFHRDIIAQLELPDALLDGLFCDLASLLQQIADRKELTPQKYDHLLSFGERFSARIFSVYLQKRGISSSHFDGWDIGILSTSDYSRAEILPETYERIPLALQNIKDIVPVITGFIAKDRDGRITTLGRGGSDLTASVVGTAIMADEVQLWKDVNGILTADPRLAPNAQSISHLSFVEAAELARFGAKVLHPASVWPAMCKNIPVRVKNYQDPAHPGTLINLETTVGPRQEEQQKGSFVAIAHKSRQALIHISSHHMLGQFEFFGSVFQILNEFNLSADVVATTHNGLSVTLEEHSSLPSLQERLQQIATVTIEHSKAFISLIGAHGRSSEFFGTVLEALNSEGIALQIISYDVSRGSATLVINDDELKRCVETLHRSFF